MVFGSLITWLGDLMTSLGNLLPLKIAIALTPVWMVGFGALLGLLTLLAMWGVTFLISRQAGMAVRIAISEGVLRWILIATIVAATFGLAGSLLVRDTKQIAGSMLRLPYFIRFSQEEKSKETDQTEEKESGLSFGKRKSFFEFGRTKEFQFEVAPYVAEDDGTPGQDAPWTEEDKFEVSFRGEELRKATFNSNVTLTIDTRSAPDDEDGMQFEVVGGEELPWYESKSASFFPPGNVSHLYVRNLTDTPATLSVEFELTPQHPEAATIPITAMCVIGVFLLYVLQGALMPKISAVALSTAKSTMAQPVFLICLAFGAFLLLAFVWIPYFTLGEDIKVLKDCSMTAIMMLGIILALWAASTSIADEIDGRTALTVLSKPIGRRRFILGKYLGIAWPVAVVFIILGLVFLVTVSYKPIYDARESAGENPAWQQCHLEMVRAVPGLVLAYMEVLILAALSVAISTRLPMLANFIICFAVFVLGNLTPTIAASSANEFAPVAFAGQLLATVLPNLDTFNIQAAVSTGREVPTPYLVGSLVYCVIYSTIAMLLALVMFEDRDLA